MALILSSCKNKKIDYFIYGSPEYTKKEEELNLNTNEASIIFTNYYFSKNPDKQNVKINLDIIYDGHYIFSDKIILYNKKTEIYYTENTYWVNGFSGDIMKSKEKKLKIHIPFPKQFYLKEEFKPNH